MNEVMPSLSDIAAVTNAGRNNDGFGGEGSWAWVIIFLIFAWGGFGRNGYGNGNGGNGGGALDNYVLASDFATLQRQIDSGVASLERKADSINNGLCDGFYAQNTNMLNGFSGVQQTLCQGFSGLNATVVTNGYETRNAINGLSTQLAGCCCDIEKGIQNVNYNMAMNTNSIQQTLCNNTRDIIESNNANYRALHDEIVANRIEDKNTQIQMQQNEINALRLKASQEAQNNYLIDQLKPCPIPAYITCNPYQSYNYGCGCNGLGTGCSGNF